MLFRALILAAVLIPSAAMAATPSYVRITQDDELVGFVDLANIVRSGDVSEGELLIAPTRTTDERSYLRVHFWLNCRTRAVESTAEFFNAAGGSLSHTERAASAAFDPPTYNAACAVGAPPAGPRYATLAAAVASVRGN